MFAFVSKTWLPRLLTLLLALAASPALAQIEHPVTWKFAATPAGADGTATLTFTAAIQGGWHVYSQFIEAGGPEPTAFAFVPSADYELLGKATESPAPTKAFDETFKMNIAYFNQRATFSQKIRLKAPKATVKGTLTFMACNDEKCLPPTEEEFSLAVQGPASATQPAATKPAAATATPATKAAPAATPTPAPTASVPPAVAPTPADTTRPLAVVPAPAVAPAEQATKAVPAVQVSAAPVVPAEADATRSLWSIFLAGFLGGLVALFMPCIFPLLPFTVSFFLKSKRSRMSALGLAAVYGLSIIAIYVTLGLAITVVYGSSALNGMASNGVFNFAFFLLLLVFAASFLGAFEIQLPNSWVTRADIQADKGGVLGIFFMAATLALVSFSCTGPIIGTLLVEASTGSYLRPAVGMFGFSLALALPFTLFAAFPALLQSLPKSGGWLNSIKVVLGFLELALALKFLSAVDLAYHWDLLDREVFLVLWIVIFGLLGLYLLGKLRFAHDSPLEFVSVPRLLLAIGTLAFAVYLVPGLWGAPLKAVTGFLPPQHTQDFDLYTPTLAAPAPATGTAAPTGPAHKYANLFKAPLGLNAYFDYDEARAAARAAGKPLLIDFTGNACVNCRKMEASVWSDATVLPLLRDRYVLVQLYVDDKAELPAAEQVTLPSGKMLHTVGQKWSYFQTERYRANSQPYYVLLDPATERVLAQPQGANYDPANFLAFLTGGLTAYAGK